MKSVLLLFFLAGSAQAQQVLECQGGSGGPGPATAVVTIQEGCGVRLIALTLSNTAVPDGLQGHFMSHMADESTGTFAAQGQIGGVDGSVHVTTGEDGQIHLTIYAGQDRRIEFGFGSHLFCTEAN